MELIPDTRDLLLSLLGHDLDAYRRARTRIDETQCETNVLRFTDEYFMRRCIGYDDFAPGLNWNAADDVIGDLLWDLRCGRRPGVSQALRLRTQTESDIAWTTGTTLTFGTIMPFVAGLFLLNTDPISLPFLFLLVLLLSPMAVAAIAHALSLERLPSNRVTLWVLLCANAALSWLVFAALFLGAGGLFAAFTG